MQINENIQEDVNYCLNCINKPCSIKGCPLSNNIPEFIKKVKENKLDEAYYTLTQTTILGSICGRICPHYKQCMGSCIRGIKGESVKIGEIEAFVSDYGIKNNLNKNIKRTDIIKGKKIAIVGGGPSGLTCSYILAKNGADVTIYEKYNKLGGILSHGIPEFRLDKTILDKTINSILELGVKVKYNMELDKDFNINDLVKKYDAIFLGIGANVSCKMNIIGEDLKGVYGGNELLEKKQNADYNNKIVSVIGGGNVAMDIARTAKRNGAKKVYIIYRRKEEQMPAEKKEIEEAKNENIEFLFQNNIVKIIGKDRVEKVECIKTQLKKIDDTKRPIPINIEGSNYMIDTDYVIMAIGSKPQEGIIEELKKDEYGYIKIDDKKRTSISKVYAGGDITHEKSTIAWAARSGRDAAYSIIEDLNK